jgi:hypothetical protein
MSGLPFAAMCRGEVLLRLAIRQAQQQADHKEECEQQCGYYSHRSSSHMTWTEQIKSRFLDNTAMLAFRDLSDLARGTRDRPLTACSHKLVTFVGAQEVSLS